MKIVAMSDLHGCLIENVEECDVVCICGDIVPLNIQRNILASIQWMENQFMQWCVDLPCKKVIFTGGNHDFVLDSQCHPSRESWIDFVNHLVMDTNKVVYLDGGAPYYYDGKCFWGAPYSTGPIGWANYIPDWMDPFANMPSDADVVLTHQPPYGSVGTVLQHDSFNYLRNFGSESLTDRLEQGDVSYLFCGHIHSGYHNKETIGHTACYNVSIKDEDYIVNYDPLVIDI